MKQQKDMGVPRPEFKKSFDKAIAEIREGGTLRGCVRKGIISSKAQFYDWINAYPEDKQVYVEAKKDQADSFVEDMAELNRQVMEEDLDPRKADFIMKNTQWLASVTNNRKYGANQNHTIEAGGELAGLLSMCHGMRDLKPAMPVEAIEVDD